MIEQIRCQRLIGRTAEIELLTDRCKEARLGRGSLVFVNGEAGIGKTRLVDEALRRAVALGLRQAKSFCLEHARSPLGPLADIVRALHESDPSILTVARNVRRVLARLVPELETQLPPDADVQGARSQYAAIAELFRRYGERHPFALVIEDAQWADVSTTEFLKYFAGKVGEMHVLLTVVTRSTAGSIVPSAAVIAELRRQRSIYSIEIEPLAPAEMQTFVQVALGAQHLAQEALRDVFHLADGNPLFAEELLASALASPSASRVLPASLRDIFLERIGRIDFEDRDILVEAAVIGRRFDPAFLAQLTKRPLERILLALRRARALQLVVEDEEHVEGVIFRHALVRETLYASILVAEARGMHRRILRELEALPDRTRRMAALAYHSWAAGEVQTALAYNERAGDEAMAQLATNEAAVFYERALSCAQADDARAALQCKLGAAYRSSGWSGRAIAMYERAYAYKRRIGELESMAEISGAISREYSSRGDGDAALRWQIAALDAVDSRPDTPAWFAAHANAVLAYAWRGEPEPAWVLLRRIEPYAGERDGEAAQDVCDARAYLDVLAGRGSEALARYRQAAADAIGAANTGVAVRAFCNLADTARVLGELHLARRAVDDAVRLADEVVVPLYRPYVLIDAGMHNVEAGQLELARRRLAQAEDAAAGLDAPRIASHLVYLGLMLAAALDDAVLDERYSSERAIDEAFLSREPWWIGNIARTFADRFGRLGRPEDAQRLIHRALAVMPTLMRAHDLAITAAVYGSDADANLARAQLVDWSTRVQPQYGSAFLELFDAYAAQRALKPASVLGVRAAERFEKLGLPLRAAEAYEVAGERAAAIEIYLRTGCTGHLARLNAPRAVDLERAALTKREREVLHFVIDGRSNREIADELGLSERTVESHIRAILGKIGGRSRHDIIRLADQRALR